MYHQYRYVIGEFIAGRALINVPPIQVCYRGIHAGRALINVPSIQVCYRGIHCW